MVDITVEEGAQDVPRANDEFWNPPTIEELARRQGIDLSLPTPPPRHIFTEEEFAGFDEWLRERRRGPWRTEQE